MILSVNLKYRQLTLVVYLHTRRMVEGAALGMSLHSWWRTETFETKLTNVNLVESSEVRRIGRREPGLYLTATKLNLSQTILLSLCVVTLYRKEEEKKEEEEMGKTDTIMQMSTIQGL